MGISYVAPSENLSADEISAAIWCGTAGGTANAITLTIPDSPTVVAGMVIAWRAAAANSGQVTIDTGSGAKPLYKQVNPVYGISNLQSGAIQNRSQNFAQWSAYHEAWLLLSPVPLAVGDIPAALNVTQFGNGILIGNTSVNAVYASNIINYCGGSSVAQSAGAYIGLSGNSHATKPGDAEYYTGSATGAAHSFFDKNGVEKLKVDENGVTLAGGSTSISGSQGVITNYVQSGGYISASSYFSSGNNPVICGGSSAPYDGAKLYLYTISHATYPGAHQQFAPLSTRAASTAIALCPVATGDTAEVEIHETTIAGCKAFVDAAGTVTLYSPIYGTVSASIVNSSSPAAGEYGVYISAGVLYFKGGSSYAGKMAHKDFVGKA